MPIVFIHGVSTRKSDPGYEKGVAARSEMLRRLVIAPLANNDARFKSMLVADPPYWGDLAAQFLWNNSTLPNVGLLEHLGGGDGSGTPESDATIVQIVGDLSGTGDQSRRLESLGAGGDTYKQAAEKDLARFLRAVISPIVLNEMDLADPGTSTPTEEGVMDALLAIAIEQVATDPKVRDALVLADTDDQVMEMLREFVVERMQTLAASGPEINAPEADLGGKQLEALGVLDKVQNFTLRVGDLFERAKGAPLRAAALPFVSAKRAGLHGHLSRFFGDVFVYLMERGDKDAPGPIVKVVIDGIRGAQAGRDGEPTIVITHSMGGNILYDILTHFDVTLKVDVWVSVGTQVGQFEEMKLFRGSDKKIRSPNRVKALPDNLGYWVNIYDPADIFGFKVAPVFSDNNADLEFLTDSPPPLSHSAYFLRPAFYDLIRREIEKALS